MKRSLLLAAARKAHRARTTLQIHPTSALSAVDAAVGLGIEVRFVSISSMEAMYVRGPPPVILVSILRPAGRRNMSCAHEVGHHVFRHGTRIGKYLESNAYPQSDEETIANAFASFFLMPRGAVAQGFIQRGFEPKDPTALQVYIVAGWLGVGYQALLMQMAYRLKLLPSRRLMALPSNPQVAREQLVRDVGVTQDVTDIIVVDDHWCRPIDAQVGDAIVLPKGAIVDGACAVQEGAIAYPVRPGIDRIATTDGWSCFLRVSRKEYVGLATYRHLEDVNAGHRVT